jgi:hypothetical protein
MPKVPPIIPKPFPIASGPAPMTNLGLPTVHIPLKYYGFARSATKSEGSRGFFMDGDNILVATEGDVLEQRYLIVALTPNTAKVEDIQVKQGQDLQVTPEALAQ